MSRRQVAVVGVAFLCALFVAASAHAELNLWVSYYISGVESYEYGHYADADTLLAEAGEETNKPCDAPYRMADTLDRAGMVCVAQQQYDKAECCYRRALDLKERSLGKESRPVPATLNNMADLYYVLDKDRECVESLYRRSLELNERDQLNVEVCRALNGLALLENDAKEYVQAEKLLQRAIAIHDKANRREHPYLATALTNLAILYTNQARYQEAEPLFERAKFIQDQCLGEDHPDVAVRLQAYATLLAKTGREDCARECQARADEITAKYTKLNAPQQ